MCVVDVLYGYRCVIAYVQYKNLVICVFGNCLLIGSRQKVEKKKMVTYLRKLIKLVLVNSVYMAIIISKESGPALRDVLTVQLH